MNRATRHAAARQAPAAIVEYAEQHRCPDCLSETSYPVCDHLGVWHINVRHDDTCPSYRRLKAKGWAW